MPEHGKRLSALFLSASWLEPPSELSFVMRALAGAASRTGDITVAVPAPTAFHRADGAFDLVGLGGDGHWPDHRAVTWPLDPASAPVVADTWTAELAALLEAANSGPVSTLLPVGGSDSVRSLQLTPALDDPTGTFMGLHVPVNEMAAQHRHNGFGFTDYLLVLSDRSGPLEPDPPTDVVAWLTAAFHSTYVVVVENATASAWLGRVRRGTVTIDTRMDMWRLLAHARVTIDAAPGPVVARECIESLRLGTPIIVPESSRAAAHAGAGGGRCFVDVAELLDHVDAVSNPGVRDTLSTAGRAYADGRYGDAHRFEQNVHTALWPTPR